MHWTNEELIAFFNFTYTDLGIDSASVTWWPGPIPLANLKWGVDTEYPHLALALWGERENYEWGKALEAALKSSKFLLERVIYLESVRETMFSLREANALALRAIELAEKL